MTRVACGLLPLCLVACATSAPPERAPAPAAMRTVAPEPPKDALAGCTTKADPKRASRVRVTCAGVVGVVERDADGSIAEESTRLRAEAHAGREPARFYLQELDAAGRVDSLRIERGEGGGVLAVARRGGKTRSVTCLYERKTRAAHERCLAVAESALRGDERLTPAADAEDGDRLVVSLDLDDDGDARGAAMRVDDALAEYGAGCEVEQTNGIHLLDCNEKLLAVLVGHDAPQEATPRDLISAMMKANEHGDDEVTFELFDGEVKTPRGTVVAKRFTAEDDEDKGGGIIVSVGLQSELRFLLCVWKDGAGREKKCESLIGALLK
jgi:hypothetical protein